MAVVVAVVSVAMVLAKSLLTIELIMTMLRVEVVSVAPVAMIMRVAALGMLEAVRRLTLDVVVTVMANGFHERKSPTAWAMLECRQSATMEVSWHWQPASRLQAQLSRQLGLVCLLLLNVIQVVVVVVLPLLPLLPLRGFR